MADIPNTANLLMTIPLVAAQRQIKEVKIASITRAILTADYYSYMYLSNAAGNIWTPLSGTNNTGDGGNEIGKDFIHISNDGTRIMSVNNKVMNSSVWYSENSGDSFVGKPLGAARQKRVIAANSIISFAHVGLGNGTGSAVHYAGSHPFTSLTSLSAGSAFAYFTTKAKRSSQFLFTTVSNNANIGKYLPSNMWRTYSAPSETSSPLIAIAESESNGYILYPGSGKIYRMINLFSTSSGAAPTFTEIYQLSRTWKDISCNNGDGLTIVAVSSEGTIAVTKDGGVTWNTIETGANLVSCDVAYDGGRIVVASDIAVYDVVYTASQEPLPPLVIVPSRVNIEVVNALPVSYDPTTLYMLKGNTPTDLKIYVSSKDGSEVRHLPMVTEIEALISAEITAATQLKVVADIAARNSLDFGEMTTLQVLVLDASADATVEVGTATYIGRKSGETITWTKIAESESMDVILQWADIINGPISSIEQIDQTVFNIHVHANKTTLDNLGTETIDTGIELTYNGQPVSIIITSEWD